MDWTDLELERAARWDITIQQGSTFLRTLEFDSAIASLSFRAQVRETHKATAILASFTFEKLDDFTLVMRMEAVTTAGLPAREVVWDLEAFTSDVEPFVVRIFEGNVCVTPEVTR